MRPPASSPSLFTFEFTAVCFVSFFAFCNMSVFYGFFDYLGRIGIPLEWRGFLLGLEPMSAFALRLAVIPLLHVGNAVNVMILSLFMMAAALWSYPWAVTIPALIVLRIFHGAAFVLLVSASMALLVHLIPRERSAQGFGIFGIGALAPYAIVPLVTETLLLYAANEARVYAALTVLAIPALALLLVLRKRLRKMLAGVSATLMKRPAMSEVRQDLQDTGVILVLGINLILYLCYSAVFYFVKSYCATFNAGDPGTFFTIATAAMIAVRALGGRFFDKGDKVKRIALLTLLLIPFFVLLGHERSPHTFYALAGYYGLCIGAILPQLNAVMVLISPPHLRGLNINLSLFAMDAAFFLTPYFGGALIAAGWSFSTLFTVYGGLLGLGLAMILALWRRKSRYAMEAPAKLQR